MEQEILRILLKNYTKIPYKGLIAKVIFDDCFEEIAAEITKVVNENDSKSSVSNSLDLSELRRKLSEALEKETPESFQKWYNKQIL